jgi:hypothetical protein
VVMATNASFSLELYLKCLLAIEQGLYLEGHYSKELFRNLSRQTKASLTRYHNNFVAGKTQFDDAVKRGFKIDLDSLLESGRDAHAI